MHDRLGKPALALTAAVLLAAAFLGTSSVTAQDTQYDSVENTEVFEKEEWPDKPSYVQNLSAEVIYSDTIQERRTVERCASYNETLMDRSGRVECLEQENVTVGGENTYIFDLENIETRYLGNGEIYLAFDVVQNEMTNELHRADNNPRQEEKFVNWFNERYLYHGENISTGEDFDKFLDFTESINVSTLGGSVKGKRLESKNLMAVSNSRVETVVELEEFRRGGVELNDAVGLRLETSAYNGGGERP